MKFFEFPTSDLEYFSLPGKLEGTRLSPKVLKRAGVFILRGLLDKSSAEAYSKLLFESLSGGIAKSRVDHLTEVSFDLSSQLAGILSETALVNLLKQFFRGKVALHNIRIVRKDKENTKAVFTHQDSPYCQGFLDRYSIFIALTESTPKNGGLFVYPGTHHFGYLGDAGFIHPDLTAKMYKLSPNLDPGDCLIMHSAVWHGSPENKSNTNRVLFDIQIQPISDPSSILSLCEEPLPSWRLRLDNDHAFLSSRLQRSRGQADLKYMNPTDG